MNYHSILIYFNIRRLSLTILFVFVCQLVDIERHLFMRMMTIITHSASVGWRCDAANRPKVMLSLILMYKKLVVSWLACFLAYILCLMSGSALIAK